MKARLPLRIHILSVTLVPDSVMPSCPDGMVECSFEVKDADDLLIHAAVLTTKPEDVDTVSRYTVDRLSAAFAVPALPPGMSDTARASLDIVLAPGGVSKGRKAP